MRMARSISSSPAGTATGGWKVTRKRAPCRRSTRIGRGRNRSAVRAGPEPAWWAWVAEQRDVLAAVDAPVITMPTEVPFLSACSSGACSRRARAVRNRSACASGSAVRRAADSWAANTPPRAARSGARSPRAHFPVGLVRGHEHRGMRGVAERADVATELDLDTCAAVAESDLVEVGVFGEHRAGVCPRPRARCACARPRTCREGEAQVVVERAPLRKRGPSAAPMRAPRREAVSTGRRRISHSSVPKKARSSR